MVRINAKEIAEEIAQDIYRGHRQDHPLVFPSGASFDGDVFYSNISHRIASRIGKRSKHRTQVFSLVCDRLRELNIWVHS